MLTAEQNEWVSHISTTKMVEILPVDANAEMTFQKVRQQIWDALGEETEVRHMGSSKLGVPGQNEIDVYIPTQPERFDQLIPLLANVFGEPRSAYPLQRIRFSAERDGKHIDLFLINENSADWEEGLMFEEYLLSHQEAVEKYRQLKLNSVGQNMQEYYRWKKEFINEIRNKDVMEKNELRLLSAETFEELLEVAYEILERMPESVGIVCGPISSGGLGSQDQNIVEFKRRIALLKDEGLEIFDQMPFETHMWRIRETPYYDPTRDHLLEVFYGNVFRHDKIKTFYFIPGWESSYGATWENKTATELGKKIVYLD